MSPAKKEQTERKSLSRRCNLVVPVTGIRNTLKKKYRLPKVGVQPSVFIAGILQYLAGEIITLSLEAAKAAKKRTLTSQHIARAINDDEDLREAFKSVNIIGGGCADNTFYPALPMTSPKPVKIKKKSIKKSAPKKKKKKKVSQNKKIRLDLD